VIGQFTIKQLIFWIQHQKYQIKPATKTNNQSIKETKQIYKPPQATSKSKALHGNDNASRCLIYLMASQHRSVVSPLRKILTTSVLLWLPESKFQREVHNAGSSE